MFKISMVVVAVIVILLAGCAFYFGIFSPVTITKITSTPFKIACLDHIGPYKGICKKIQNAKKLLDTQKIRPLSACGIYYDDPKSVSGDKLRSKGGYIVPEDTKQTDILELIDIPSREIISAKIKAHPCIAPFKIYPKINKWLAANNYTPAGPCLEIYHAGGNVETQMPISPKQKETKPAV